MIAALKEYKKEEQIRSNDDALINQLISTMTKDEKVGAVRDNRAPTQSKTIEVDRDALKAIVKRLK